MRIVLTVIRKILGWIIRFFDWITRPEPVKRPEDEQARIEDEIETLAVYEFDG